LSLIISGIIFFGFPQLSNFNVEDYIILGIFASAGAAAFLTYKRAASRKKLHALAVFFAVCVLTVAVFVLPFLILFVYCRIATCRFFPL